MTARIYLLVGDTGEYSDHTQWNVAAYTTREQAELHRQRLLEVIKPPQGSSRPAYWAHMAEVLDKVRAELDPACHDDGDLNYTVVELRLHAHLDEFLETL